MARSPPDPKPAPTTSKLSPAWRAKSLPQEEVQALADLALKAWETGAEESRTDSAGGAWVFLQMRSPDPGLRMTRRVHEGPVVERFAGQKELGAHAHVSALLSALVNGIAAG